MVLWKEDVKENSQSSGLLISVNVSVEEIKGETLPRREVRKVQDSES